MRGTSLNANYHKVDGLFSTHKVDGLFSTHKVDGLFSSQLASVIHYITVLP